MATKAVQYAQALKAHTADPDGGKSFADRLVKFLIGRKQGKLLASVLAAYSRLQTQGTEGAKVIVARTSGKTHHAKEIEADLKMLAAEEGMTLVDDSLVGGYIVRTPHAQVDKSYRSALLNMYQKITN